MSQTPRTDAGTITIRVGAETWVVCRLDVAAEMERELVAARAEVEALREALADALSGWRYSLQTYCDLYGVGWDRVEDKANAALAREKEPQP